MPPRSLNRVYFESLGCAKNLVDSEVMLGFLARAGYRFVNNAARADIIILNTCAFIQEATAESCAAINRAAEQKRHGRCAYLIVCGCLPQRYGQRLLAQFPAVDLFLGSAKIHKIVDCLHQITPRQKIARLYCGPAAFLMSSRTPRIITTPGASAYVKIAEGCSHRCTYCSIPGIRGPYQSRSTASIVNEVNHMSRRGIREVNLIAQDTTGHPALGLLLQRLARIPALVWIRLLYCHPGTVDKKLINVLAQEEKICKYIDLPIQHISDPILKKMGRRTTRRQLELLIAVIRQACPHIALRTTVMVGFPGEQEQHFEELLDFIAAVRFDHLGAFEYRAEDGTAAARLPGNVPDTVKRERFNRLMLLQAEIAKAKSRARVGQHFNVLVEGPALNKKFVWQARADFQAPEVDGVVLLNDPVATGSFVHVKAIKALGYDIVGRVV